MENMQNNAIPFNYGAGDTKGDAKLLRGDLRRVGEITDGEPSAYGAAVIESDRKARKASRWDKLRFWLPSLVSVVGGTLALSNPDFMNAVVCGLTVGPVVLTSLFASVPYLSLLQPWLSKKASEKASEEVQSIRGKLLSSAEHLNNFIKEVEQGLGVTVDRFHAPKLGDGSLEYVGVTYYGEYKTADEPVLDSLTGESVGTKSSQAHVYSVDVNGGSEKVWLMASRNFLVGRDSVDAKEFTFPEVYGYGPNDISSNASVQCMVEWAEGVARGVEDDLLQGVHKTYSTFFVPVSDGSVDKGFDTVLNEYASGLVKKRKRW